MIRCEIVEIRNSADAVGFPCSRTASTQCSDCGSEAFGRSFVLRVHERDNGALHLQAAEQDTGNDYMTPHDLACLLQTDVKSVCRQTETRAQQRAKFPMPFFKLNGKLRFERKTIQEWLQNIANSAPTFKPAKRGRPRKTKLQ